MNRKSTFVFSISVAIISLGIVGTPATPVRAQQTDRDAIYIIFDASGSMWGQLPDTSPKITVARSVLSNFIEEDFGDKDLAFRVYGHRREGDCRDSELMVPFGSPATVVGRVQAAMREIQPLGKTPITHSLREAMKDLGDRRGQIIVITDGIENCDDDPCAVVRDWKESGVAVNIHVVGLGVGAEETSRLQCISDAAGTPYHGADSAMELAGKLATIQQQATDQTPGEPSAFEGDTTVGFWIQGTDKNGNAIQIEGSLIRDNEAMYEVSSNSRNQIDAGAYELLVGVRTVNGSLYRPVSRSVVTAAQRDTVIHIEVERPPSVRAIFSDDGEELRGANIRAYQNGEEVFTFRWIDEVFVDEGTYEFRARPNADNELSLTETLLAGDRKQIVFELIHTVHAKFDVVAEGSGVPLSGNLELWQDGDRKYQVHRNNGATILPGIYDVHLVNELNPYVAEGIVVASDADRQEIELSVPVAVVTFVYLKEDGTRDMDKRVFLGAGPTRRGRVKQSGVPQVLLPGTYNVVGWQGSYDTVVFTVASGDTRNVVLREKK